VRRVNIASPEFRYDPDDPEGFRSGMFRLGPQLGADRTGATVYQLAPGEALCPFHYEYAEEEWLVVLDGTPTIRHPEGNDVLQRWDVVRFPVGPDGAHLVRNDTEDEVRVLMFSNVAYPNITIYPDSDKLGAWTGNRDDDLIARRSSAVDYFEGEQ
jgi:uncharacterized cupin superfamily protein